MSQAQAEPCRWHSDTLRKMLSKSCECVYVCVGVGGNETCQQMDRSVGLFPKHQAAKKTFPSFLL